MCSNNLNYCMLVFRMRGLLLVVFNDLWRAHLGLIWVAAKLSQSPALTQQIPTLVQFVMVTAAVEHSRQHRYVEIRVVVDAHLPLVMKESMQPTNVLRDRPLPRDRQRQE